MVIPHESMRKETPRKVVSAPLSRLSNKDAHFRNIFFQKDTGPSRGLAESSQRAQLSLDRAVLAAEVVQSQHLDRQNQREGLPQRKDVGQRKTEKRATKALFFF